LKFRSITGAVEMRVFRCDFAAISRFPRLPVDRETIYQRFDRRDLAQQRKDDPLLDENRPR
jgi:hypothetical protein